jgi:hypothetical protein
MAGPGRRGLARYQRARGSSVPPAMIAAATAAREAGDWRGACAAAGFDVSVDLVAVRRDHGGRAADALAEDLAHFAPDLLRWHLPRVPEQLSVVPWATVVLSPADRTAPRLEIVPPHTLKAQRLELRVADRVDLTDTRFFDAPRHLWDVRRAADLREAWGGSASRPPLLNPDGTSVADHHLGVDPDAAGQTERILNLLASGRHVDAWRAAGIELEPPDPERGYAALDADAIWPVGLADEARRLVDLYRIRVLNVAPSSYHPRAVVTLARDGSVTARVTGTVTMIGQPHIPASVCQVPVDLELLRYGLMTPDELHPLVLAALFPGLGLPPAASPTLETPSVRVRCRGVWHRVQVVDGRITALDHDPDEERRESVVRALGGTSSGCFAVLRTWTDGRGRLPRLLRAHRTEIYERLFHGDTAFLIAMLDAGRLDPRMRVGPGHTLMHMLVHLDHEALLPRLLAAGVPIDARDHEGRTPLHVAVVRWGPTALVRALREAGADPDATDNTGRTVRDAARLAGRDNLAAILE